MVNAVLDQLARQLRAARVRRAAGRRATVAQGSAEDRLIARYFKPLAKHPGAFGLADDAAAITPPAGHDLVLKTDGLIAGVHFFPDDPADGVAPQGAAREPLGSCRQGRRAARLPAGDRAAEGIFRRLARGLRARARRGRRCATGVRCSAATRIRRRVRSAISIAAFGTLPHRHDGEAQRREGRRPRVRQRHDRRCGARPARAPGRSRKPGSSMPRCASISSRAIACRSRAIALAEAVRAHASAAMDVSDGLAGDLAKLCARLECLGRYRGRARAAVAAAAQALGSRCDADRADPDRRGGLRDPLRDRAGSQWRRSARAAAKAGVPVTEIGRIVAGDRAAAVSRSGQGSALDVFAPRLQPFLTWRRAARPRSSAILPEPARTPPRSARIPCREKNNVGDRRNAFRRRRRRPPRQAQCAGARDRARRSPARNNTVIVATGSILGVDDGARQEPRDAADQHRWCSASGPAPCRSAFSPSAMAGAPPTRARRSAARSPA